MSPEKKMWLVFWAIYLIPMGVVIAEFAAQMIVANAGDCLVDARGAHPCIVFGRDVGAWLSGSVFFGYAVAFFLLPWLIIGGIILMVIRLLLGLAKSNPDT